MLKPTPRVKQAEAEGACECTLRALFDAQESRLLRYAFSLTGNRAVAEEIVQEVFLRLHARWGTVDEPTAWLNRSVRNRAFDHLRSRKRESLCLDDGASSMASQDESPEAMLLRMESMGAVREAIQNLASVDRRLIELKYFQGMRYREISEQTGLTISNVGFRLHHLLKKLGVILGTLGIDEKS